VHIRRAIDGDLRPLIGDGERLHKLLLSLARHALEHASGPMLVLGAEAEESADVLYVRDPSRVLGEADLARLRLDTGAPRSDTHAPRSEPDAPRSYTRAPTSDTAGLHSESGASRRKGLGEDARLLMRLCERVAQEHGGHARIESDAQQGTRFSLCLPLARARTAAPLLESSSPPVDDPLDRHREESQ
jgi:hypothetical protein